jgi:PAS domain S-box-containing protein
MLNRTCSVLMACFAVWSFPDIFSQNPGISNDTARLLENISSFGWIGFSCTIFCFALVFSKNERIFKTKIFIPVVILPLFFIYKQWTNFLVIDCVQQPYGWQYNWSDTIWTYLFYAYYISFTLAAIYLVYRYGKKTDNLREKKSAKIIVATVTLGLVGGTIFDVVIPMLNIRGIPSLANVFVLIFALGLVYAIVKYRFLTINSAVAAEKIISAMDELLVLLETDGTIAAVNKAALDSLGYDRNELEGKPAGILFKDDDLKRLILEKTIKGESLKNHEVNFQTKSREEIPVIFSNSPLKDSEGGIIGVVLIARDITERKLAEKEKEKLQMRLFQSDKMTAVGQLAGGVAHEINNPMGVILGFAQTIARDMKEGDPLYMPLKSIEREAIRCKTLVGDLLTFSRTGKTQMEVIYINGVIEEILSLVEARTKVKNVGIIRKYGIDLPQVMINKNQIQQVIMNLCNNAIDAMTGTGKLTIITKQTDNWMEIDVADTGNGMTEEVKKHMFEPFYTTKEIGKGTGLGLSLCYEIIQRHNGTIKAESELGKGTIFIVKLPIKQ